MPDHIDEFQSIFRGAERQRFAYVDVPIQSVSIITDVGLSETEAIRDEVMKFLPRLSTVSNYRLISDDQYSNVAELRALVDEQQTDLLITFRHLQERSLIPQHSLGVYLDTLTQTTSIPVLVLPGVASDPHPLSERICNRVMVVADHISGDSRLINYGVRMCREGGTIWLVHIEDDRIFERYMHVIERIAEIDTSDARSLIEARLTKDVNQFLADCVVELEAEGPNATYKTLVRKGHHLKEYSQLADEYDVDLLVFNTKDDDQLAMHGKAYSLAVELTTIPMLML